MTEVIIQAQQSRYHADTITTSQEIDLKDVSISVASAAGDVPLLISTHVRLKEGVRYAFLGRNGTGKSTLMQALADRTIPGINPALKIVMLSQIEESSASASKSERTVLQTVLERDKERTELIRRQSELHKAANSVQLGETHRILCQLEIEEKQLQLEEARRLATRRSGARGKEARKEEIKAEEELKEAKEKLTGRAQADDADRVVKMLADVELQLNLMESESADSKARAILSGLGFTAEMIDSPYAQLSGGWRGRCGLSIALLVQADVLLLDEPSNFLDLEALLWLEHFLCHREGTVLVTSHDQTFLDNVAQETAILRHSTLRYFPGTPTAQQLAEKRTLKSKLKQQAALDKRKEHVQASISQGMAAGKKSGDDKKVRMAKSRQKKLDERWGLEKSAKGGRFKLNRDMAGYFLGKRGEIEFEDSELDARITLPETSTLRTVGNLIHFDKVAFNYKHSKSNLLEDVTFTIPQGARLAIVGQNGQGKSTIARLLIGEIKPTSGSIEKHPTATIGYYSQHLSEQLSSIEDTPVEHFTKAVVSKEGPIDEQTIRKSLAAFGLTGKTVSATAVKNCSGGQKVRLALALVAYWKPSLFLLDEPSAHLDISTVQALGKALRGYGGAVVIITHDRWLCRYAIEGLSFADAFGDDAAGIQPDDQYSDSDSEEDVKTGEVLRVVNGKVKKMDGGIEQYANIVRRKLAKRLAVQQ